ncbi:MAG: lipopolysaccharide kinase InaA family protein [Pyrinomonadaceae bacterium]
MFDSQKIVETVERLPHWPLAFMQDALESRTRWRELCIKYDLRGKKDFMWRYGREWKPGEPDQGWKIHISATILSACDVLDATVPLLKKHDALFKVIASLDELEKLNSGLWYGYSQIGKFITVYPVDVEHFRTILSELAPVIPSECAAPSVPFDLSYPNAPNLFYRYGGFSGPDITDDAGRAISVIKKPDGSPTEDRRNVPVPDWMDFPFTAEAKVNEAFADSPLTYRYRIFRSISQRGKGGVYEAIDIQTSPPNFCIVKEGRRHGETAWDGRDGSDRVRNEAKVLRELKGKVPGIPAVIDEFSVNQNVYLVIEKLEGETLQRYARSHDHSLSEEEKSSISDQIRRILDDMHAAGWVWRDCKPGNLFISPEGVVRPIDFEGATPISSPDFLPWNTPEFAPPDLGKLSHYKNLASNLPEDHFALDACITFLENSAPSGSKLIK